MDNHSNDRARIQLAIEHLHKCRAKYVYTVEVNEFFRGEAAWSGEVEVFELTGHPRTRRCYSWRSKDGSGEKIEIFLEIPPVESPSDAVRAHLLEKRRKAQQPQSQQPAD
jgi:hypothetical protein